MQHMYRQVDKAWAGDTGSALGTMDAPADHDDALKGVLRVPFRSERRQIPVEIMRVHYLPVRRPVSLAA